MTGIAASIAADQARKRGKTYLVSFSVEPSRAVYIFACDHPDDCNPVIYPALGITPTAHLPIDHLIGRFPSSQNIICRVDG